MNLTFLFAGHDTTSSLVTSALYLLAKHPESQRKVQKELDETFENEPSYDDISKLKYLDNVIKESLRMYPPGGYITRKSHEDCVFKDYPIPKNSDLYLNIIGLHYNPLFWKTPQMFNPDRFNEPYEKYAYIPFSVGPRDYAGRNFAYISAPTILSLILKHYNVEFNDDEKIRVDMTFVTKIFDLKLKLIKRIK